MERIKLNLIPSGVAPIVHLSQYDDGRQFGIDLFEGESVYVLDGTETLTVNSRKPDGHVVTLSVTNTGTNSLDVDTVEQLTAVHGVSYSKLQIVKGSVTIATLPFLIDVSRDPLENGDPSESFIQNLRTQIAEGVAEEVATQYDSANVIFDTEPTSGHGTPYTVTSEGIKTAIDNAFDYDNTASGSLVHITDGADNIPVKSLVSEIVAVETGNGQPKSPDNPYTISGVDNGIITRCGKNLCNWKVNTTSYPLIISLPKGTYTISSDGTSTFGFWYFRFTDINGNVITDNPSQFGLNNYNYSSGSQYFYGGNNRTDVTFIAPDYGYTVRIGTLSGNGTVSAMLVQGSTATPYEPYTSNTYTFAFGQTVYGGHFDNKGNLVVTYAITTINNNWSMYSSYFYRVFNDKFVPAIGDTDHYLLCSMLPYDGVKQYAVQISNESIGQSNNKNIYIVDNSCADIDAFHAKYNGATIIYPLANPIVLPITSQDIPTLLGENNIFSNCGDVEVDYYTDKSNDILDFINSEIGKKNGTNIPIEENSQDSIKDYIDDEISGTKDYVDNGLSGKADSTDLPFVKYEEIDVVLDSTGEGTLFSTNKYVVGIKDIPSDSLYVGYAVYFAGTQTKCKAISRQSVGFTSQSIVSTTRKIGVYYLDNIATQ